MTLTSRHSVAIIAFGLIALVSSPLTTTALMMALLGIIATALIVERYQ